MKFRIAIWAGVGALVVVLWNLYISATSPTQFGTVWYLVYLTCPIALAHRYTLSFYFVLLVNAVTYALVGTVVETMRRHYKQTRLISN
jgi:predicted cobalt transporter CbtA